MQQTISDHISICCTGLPKSCNLWVKQLLDFMNYPSLECLGRIHSISVKDVILDHSMAIVRVFFTIRRVLNFGLIAQNCPKIFRQYFLVLVLGNIPGFRIDNL